MGVSVMSKGKEARRIKSSFYPARNKDVLVSVKVNLEGYDQVTKRKAEMPVEAVKVWLVSDYGLKIPLSYVPNSKEGTVVEYAIRLPEDLPYPFEGRIEVTSGLWINEQNLRISIGPKIGEEAEASPGLSVEDIDRIVGGITDPQDVLYLLWEMGLAFEWKGVDAAPKTGAGFAGLVDGYGEIRGPEGTGGFSTMPSGSAFPPWRP
jgi:hypothetical protein